MAIMEVDKDMMTEIFELKENVKKSVYAVMEGRLTAGHLASDVFVLLEKLDKLEVMLIGEPLVQEVPLPAEESQTPPQEEQPQESVPTEQPQPEQPKPEGQ